MPPLFMTVKVGQQRLWLPLLLVWVLLLPLFLVVAPFALFALLALRVNPFPAFAAFWRLLSATRGTRIEVQDQSQEVFVHIY